MTNAHMTHYQSLLLTERVQFAPPAVLNPATLLPEANNSLPVHQCMDILAEETRTKKDLTDQQWPGCHNWYTAFLLKVSEKWGSCGQWKTNHLGQELA